MKSHSSVNTPARGTKSEPDQPVVCFTSATFAYLDRARTLLETIRRHHPDWQVVLCLCEWKVAIEDVDINVLGFDRVVGAEDLGIRDFSQWMFEHDLVEACTAVKGPMLRRLLDEGAERVVYLDPDIALFAPLDDVLALMDDHAIVLTPHQLAPETSREGVIDNEIGSLKYGIFNLGFLAVTNSDQGRRLASWWENRLYEYCFDEVSSGIFTDQKWFNHVPVLFDEVAILKSPGYNVACWNISQRPLEIGADGEVIAGGEPLRFFHFTKIDGPGVTQLERYGRSQLAVFELMEWYADALQRNAVPGIPTDWSFSHFVDRTPIPASSRRAYRQRRVLKQRVADPFSLTYKQFVAEAEKAKEQEKRASLPGSRLTRGYGFEVENKKTDDDKKKRLAELELREKREVVLQAKLAREKAREEKRIAHREAKSALKDATNRKTKGEEDLKRRSAELELRAKRDAGERARLAREQKRAALDAKRLAKERELELAGQKKSDDDQRKRAAELALRAKREAGRLARLERQKERERMTLAEDGEVAGTETENNARREPEQASRVRREASG